MLSVKRYTKFVLRLFKKISEEDFIISDSGICNEKEDAASLLNIWQTLDFLYEDVEFMDDLFWGTNIIYIDAPEGIYIYGEENRIGNKRRWYAPEELEKALVYDHKKEKAVRLDELLTYEKWWEFTNVNKIKQDMQHPDPVEEKPVPCAGPSGTGNTAKILKAVLLNELVNKNVRMSKEEMTSFIDRISRTELLMEIKDLSDGSIYPRYLKAIRVSLIELGYDQTWVETEFRDALEAKYMQR